MSRYLLAIDVGGTFTDIICYDTADSTVRVVKTPSTPPDFIDGMLGGIAELDIAADAIKLIKIGTTIATNTIIMRTGAKTALVTTAGFTDVLHAARAARPTLYDSDWDPAPALVSRQDTLTVAERLDYEGEIIEALDADALGDIAATLAERGIEAIAVSFLHSYINGAHEQQARDVLAQALPAGFICVSSDILPEIREFERTSTTVANAYLGPVLERYLAALLEQLDGIGYAGDVLITHSGGGVMSVEEARRIPARICQSGPAAGVVSGASIGTATGRPNIISLDIGGTSADVSLARDGKPLVRAEWNIEINIVINFPSIDVVAIGAGGGSIARVDQGGVLKVGPDSAGANPGPACYGRGGENPTVTDANLLLGRLSPDSKLAGRVGLDQDLCAAAISRVAEPMDYQPEAAAAGILKIMRANMAGAIRLVSVKRGHDPREFALAAFGGAGPLHAVELARELEIPEVVVPYYPGLASAMGVLFVEIRHDFVQSIFATNQRFDSREINRAFATLEDKGRDRLRREGVAEDRIQLARMLDVRFYGQVSGGLTLPVAAGTLGDADVRDVFKLFHVKHNEEFGYTLPEDMAELEIVNARISAEGERETVPLPVFPLPAARTPEPSASRPVYFDDAGWLDTAIWQRGDLPVGHVVEGPAIIEQNDTTTLLPPGSHATVDPTLNLICTTRGH